MKYVQTSASLCKSTLQLSQSKEAAGSAATRLWPAVCFLGNSACTLQVTGPYNPGQNEGGWSVCSTKHV
jgi:hypothetical protein